MQTSIDQETFLNKVAAGLVIVALISMAVWGLSLYLISGDGDTYPGGALGLGARIGLGGTVVAVTGLVIVCMIGLVRLVAKAFQQRGGR